MRILLISLIASVLPLSAFAHGDKIAMAAEGIAAGLKKFEADNADQVAGFAGVKGWIDADKVMVKVYLPNSASMTYGCAMMEMGGGQPDMFTCVKQ